MKNWMMLLGAVALLSSCGRYDFQPAVSFGADADDAGTGATVTRVDTINTKTDQVIGRAYTNTAPLKGTVFSFSSRPGSQGGYITSYKITRDEINGQDFADSTIEPLKVDIYIPSGYICPVQGNVGGQPGGTPIPGNYQACSINDPTSIPGNAFAPKTVSFDFTSGLIPKAAGENLSQSREVDITFIGYSATYQPIEIKLTNIYSGVVFLVGKPELFTPPEPPAPVPTPTPAP